MEHGQGSGDERVGLIGPAALTHARLISAFALILLGAVSLLLPFAAPRHVQFWLPSSWDLLTEDLPMVPPLLALVLALQPDRWRPRAVVPGSWPLAAAAAIVLLCWWGHYALLLALDLSGDEQRAASDAMIFSSGRLMQPVPPGWRAFVPALNDRLMLPVAGHAAWASSYLPVNAAIRALVGLVADPALAPPLLAGAGLIALWRVALRLFPDSPGARAVALLCYAGSSQVLVTAMSAYAMTAHLALNLAWLALFLRRDRVGQAGALAVGFLATGLHQPFPHLWFAAPFVLLEWRRSRRAFLVYGAGYALIAAFWVAWPNLDVALAGGSGGAVGFAARRPTDMFAFNLETAWMMTANLLRFATWQHPLLLPLAVLGCGLARREGVPAALVASLVLPVVAMTVLLPWQGHGWGYRYLHGVIGSACLLAGYGWRRAERSGLSPARGLLIATLADLLLLVPAHGWMAHRASLPGASLSARIVATPANAVIVDAAPYAFDTVVNRPDLSNRPLRLFGPDLAPALLPALCARGTVAFVDGATLGAFSRGQGDMHPARTGAHQQMLHAAAARAGCRIVPAAPETPR